jgi:hypothetical protein
MITRAKAIRTFWAICKEREVDDIGAHQLISEAGFSDPSLSVKNAAQLGKILRYLGVNDCFVEEDKTSYKLQKIIEKSSFTWEDATVFAQRHLHLKGEVEDGAPPSIYHLPHKKKWKLCEIFTKMVEDEKALIGEKTT